MAEMVWEWRWDVRGGDLLPLAGREGTLRTWSSWNWKGHLFLDGFFLLFPDFGFF